MVIRDDFFGTSPEEEKLLESAMKKLRAGKSEDALTDAEFDVVQRKMTLEQTREIEKIRGAAAAKPKAADWRKSFANIDKAVGEETKRAVTNKDVIRLQRIEEIHEAQIRNPEIKGRGEIAKVFQRGRLSGISPAALEEAIRREQIRKAEEFVARQGSMWQRFAKPALMGGIKVAGPLLPFLTVLSLFITVDNLGFVTGQKIETAKANFNAKIWTKERYLEEVEHSHEVMLLAGATFEVPFVRDILERIAPAFPVVFDETLKNYENLAETIANSTEEQLRAGAFPTLETRIEEAKILQEKKNEFFEQGRGGTQEGQNIRERREIMEERSARLGEIEGLYKNATVAAREDPVLRRLEGERRAAEAKMRAAGTIQKEKEPEGMKAQFVKGTDIPVHKARLLESVQKIKAEEPVRGRLPVQTPAEALGIKQKMSATVEDLPEELKKKLKRK